MNWDTADFDWNQARAFLATAEEGSLSAAARALGVTQPTLSRQVSALEEKLGITLFERGPRMTSLTSAGLEVLDHVRAMHEAAAKLSLSASGQSQAVAGLVRIATTDTLACCHLPNMLLRLRKIAPDIEVEIRTSNKLRDLLQREADIAIRHARPREPELIAKKVRTTSATLYASKDYLDRAGRPRDVGDLQKLKFIGVDTRDTLIQPLKQKGLPLITSNFTVSADSGLAAIELARKGLGVGLFIADEVDQFPDLEIVWPDFKPFDVPIWLVTHRELHTSKRIRLMFDLISDYYSLK
ncbi:MAG: LysR family transcriptional regulator [Hyphomonas sp.]|mgnify:FL=1|uniref:LysR family transcriptional regulator n=1 Tax=Hyphomonas sp. TaxID=87 RepID=UPI000C57029C|nr:LysR family transcriptional regulator [Hyphomonas sp.]MBB42108.1 LysR family transcriptional regulator [Hyphomonas sp.]|tara:strand:+ start:775 stop:1665 length:891 start_codon:yes stop_codon:yes gene_type:complete